MPQKIYLWIEDRKDKSSYLFWKTLMHYISADIIVESKNNNSELIKAVKALKDDKNKYIIVLDNSFDNLQIYQEYKELKNYVKNKKNIYMLDIICFEYILLEFKSLINWIYAEDDEFLTKRAETIIAREKFINSIASGNMNYKDINEIISYDCNLKNYNVEQLSAKLLFDLTRNTGFEVTKGNIGDCWIKSCCKWDNRQSDDKCGLDNKRLDIDKKMKKIYKETSLCKEFSKIGLEVSI